MEIIFFIPICFCVAAQPVLQVVLYYRSTFYNANTFVPYCQHSKLKVINNQWLFTFWLLSILFQWLLYLFRICWLEKIHDWWKTPESNIISKLENEIATAHQNICNFSEAFTVCGKNNNNVFDLLLLNFQLQQNGGLLSFELNFYNQRVRDSFIYFFPGWSDIATIQ